MHRTTKRLASALLAAALCFAAALPAGADYEPWTYEVDDVMSTYGVEYYGDVGFDLPKKSGGTASYSADTASPVTYAAEDGTAVYAVEDWDTYAARVMAEDADSAIVTQSENSNTYIHTGYYTVTIPADVSLDETNTSGTVSVTGTLILYNTLNIEVDSQNGYQLKCAGDAIDYDVTSTDFTKTGNVWSCSITSNDVKANGNSETYTKSLDISVTGEPKMSGTYTDQLNFTLECRRKKFQITYNSGEGTGTDITLSYNCGTSEVLAPKPTTFDKTDGTFVGWKTKDGTKIYRAGTLISSMASTEGVSLTDGSELTLYAQWTDSTDIACTFNIYFQQDDGTYNSTPDEMQTETLKNGVEYVWVRDKSNDADKNKWATASMKVTPSATNCEFNVYVAIKSVQLNLNGCFYDKDDEIYYKSTTLSDPVNHVEMATVDLTVNGTTKTYKDLYTAYKYGTTYTFNNITPTDGYECIGYFTSDDVNWPGERWEKATKDEITLTPITNGSVTRMLKGMTYGTDGETLIESIYFVFQKKDDAKTLLPVENERKSVVVDMPDTSDIAAEDTTPDELMITDADEMLTTLDAAFAVPDFDPVY